MDIVELETAFGVTPDQLDVWEREAAVGSLPGKSAGPVQKGPGRPAIFGEEMRQVGFKEPLRKISAIDARAAQLGLRRSDYLRALVDADLAAAGVE